MWLHIFECQAARYAYDGHYPLIKLELTGSICKVGGPELAPSTGSGLSLAFTKQWIEACTSTHPECHRAKAAKLPTRLIQLFDNGGIRLYARPEINSRLEYVTLSHCWGTFETLKLTKSNVDTFRESIPIENLCKTFQDAILATRALGFKYLWIDSLCIIQDDDVDWRQESALMSEVYGNAIVNIAATNAKDSSVGLFSQRDVSRSARQYVRTNTSKTYELLDSRVYYRCLDKTPLSSRAWVFQERYLAKRTIYFILYLIHRLVVF
jgi:hypothetical protein